MPDFIRCLEPPLPSLPIAVLALWMGFCPVPLDAAEPEDPSGAGAWEAGQNAFYEGDYAGAARSFDLAISMGISGPEVYYNLGAAREKAGETAQAVVEYLRATLMDPSLQPARQALARIASEKRFALPPQSLPQRLVARVGSRNLWILGSATAWVGAFGILAGFFFRRGRNWWILAGILVLILGKSIVATAWLGDPLVTARKLAVVRSSEPVALRGNPTDSAGAIERLPSGAVVKHLSERGRWTYCKLPGGKEGWLPTEKLVMVLPGSGS